MKKMLCRMMALCLLLTLLLPMAGEARAASGSIEKCLQFVRDYNPDTGEFDEYSYPCVLVKTGQNNLVITAKEPKSGWITIVYNPADGKWWPTEYAQSWNKALHMYVADSSHGENEGYLSVGSATKNETIRYVAFNQDWNQVVVETVALEYEPGQIIPKDPIETGYTVAVVNSKNEVCAIEYAGICMTLATDEETFYGSSGQQETEPPATQPPAQQSTGAINALQKSAYLDGSSKDLVQESITSAVLLQYQGLNLVFTKLQPRDDMTTVFTSAAGNEIVLSSEEAGQFAEEIYMYITSDEYGEQEGFYPGGTVKKDEKITLVYWDWNNYERKIIQGKVTDYSNGRISTTLSGNLTYLALVLNSRDEVCGIYYGDGVIYPLITDEATFYGDSQSGETEPPATEPPATEPPVTEPPATEDNELIQDKREVVKLTDLDKLYGDAIVKKKSSRTGIYVLSGLAVAAVMLVVAVVVVKKKNKQRLDLELNEAEEGTQLADVFVDTGMQLRFNNGECVSVLRSLTVGRAPDNDIVIPKTSSSVSGHHCEIVLTNGVVYLRDVGSTNGTFVNGRRITPGQLVQLHGGMRVSLGGGNSREGFVVTVNGSRR